MAEFASSWLEFSPETLGNSGTKSTKTGSATFDTPISERSGENSQSAAAAPEPGATAGAAAAWWFNRIGDGWPRDLSMNDPAVVPLLDRLGEDVAAALDADDAAAVIAAFQQFRRVFAPVWRARRPGDGGAA